MMSLTQDQYRFLMANLASLSLALPFKYIPRSVRNEFNYLPGVLMVYYCFGNQANNLILFSAISYAICKYTPGRYVQRITLCTSLAFLAYAHLSRQILDYGGYVLDISGPFMIAVQKMTSLGFCLHDGSKKLTEIKRHKQRDSCGDVEEAEEKNISNTKSTCNNNNNNNNNNNEGGDDYHPGKTLTQRNKSASLEKYDVIQDEECRQGKRVHQMHDDYLSMTEEQRKYAVTESITFSEFMGYFFHFPSVLCGPIMQFNDYRDFVRSPSDKPQPPGRYTAVAKKLTISTTCAILHLTLNPKFEVEFLRSPEFLINTPLPIRFVYIIVFTMLSRLKYYVAWHLGEAISNASGLGFNGYDSNGKAQWNLISNMDLLKFETCLSLRDALHAWNKTTQTWLRRTAYERVPRKLAVVATYILSAFWHGFYPGYYMTFLSGALFTYASRDGRRVIRPPFQKGRVLPIIYDIITFTLTRLTIAYVAFPFVILDFKNNFEIYKSLYFSLHVLGIAGILIGRIFNNKKK